MELDEADCLELGCLKQPGYFLSRDCSLLVLSANQDLSKGLSSWDKKKKPSKCSGTTHSKMADLLLVQFFFFDLQLQHNGIELHVKVVGSLQLPLVVLPDVQRMPASNVGFFFLLSESCSLSKKWLIFCSFFVLQNG